VFELFFYATAGTVWARRRQDGVSYGGGLALHSTQGEHALDLPHRTPDSPLRQVA
jgi:hypothetical protein